MSTIKVDTVRPVTTDGSLTLQGDSSGSGVTGLVIDSTGTVTTFNASNINGGQLGGFRNLIINGNFQVNQRGQTSGAVAVDTVTYYTVDRWKLATASDTISWGDSGGIRTVTIPSGDVLTQVIEGLNIVSGTYVISWVGTATCTVDTVAKSSGDTFTLTAGTNCTVAFTNGTVSKVQVEAGSTATAFEHRPYGTELVLCQRYYETQSIFSSYGSATYISICVNYKVLKRATPTSVIVDAAGNTNRVSAIPVSGGATVNNISLASSAETTDYFRATISGAAGTYGGATFTVKASAEL